MCISFAANILVIVVIFKNDSLRRRHGYIKMSLAAADLLIGLLVVPAVIYNIAVTLYFPTVSVTPQRIPFGRLFRPVYHHHQQQDAAEKFFQRNSLASVFFGTVLVTSFIASIYNLLLLSADRLAGFMLFF